MLRRFDQFRVRKHLVYTLIRLLTESRKLVCAVTVRAKESLSDEQVQRESSDFVTHLLLKVSTMIIVFSPVTRYLRAQITLHPGASDR